MNKNLWKIPTDVSSIRTPKGIMEEQATHLAQMTNGLLMAEVKLRGTFLPSYDFSFSFDIVAPVLNAYRVTLFEVRQPQTMYPLDIISDIAPVVSNLIPLPHGTSTNIKQNSFILGECANSDEFEVVLGKILSSEEVQKVVAALLAQSR